MIVKQNRRFLSYASYSYSMRNLFVLFTSFLHGSSVENSQITLNFYNFFPCMSAYKFHFLTQIMHDACVNVCVREALHGYFVSWVKVFTVGNCCAIKVKFVGGAYANEANCAIC